MANPATLSWPSARFHTVPPARHAASLASSVLAGADRAGLATYPEVLAAAAGWRVVRRPLQATTGGLQALMGPVPDGGFLFTVDDRATPDELAALHAYGLFDPADSIFRWRLAHELGHVFFYGDRRPHERLPMRTTSGEETFCDLFALALLTSSAVASSLDVQLFSLLASISAVAAA